MFRLPVPDINVHLPYLLYSTTVRIFFPISPLTWILPSLPLHPPFTTWKSVKCLNSFIFLFYYQTLTSAAGARSISPSSSSSSPFNSLLRLPPWWRDRRGREAVGLMRERRWRLHEKNIFFVKNRYQAQVVPSQDLSKSLEWSTL